MKNTIKVFGIIALVAVIVITDVSCSGSGSKSFNSTDALKKYLDKQPANSADKPIKIAMKLNEQMFEKVKDTINDADKYVSLDLTGSPAINIPEEAFRGCKQLAGIIIPKSITRIGEGAFAGTSLTSVNIPDSVTSIGNGSFFSCTSLTIVNIPNSVTSIGVGTFANCTSLSSITIPDSVTSIGDGAFGFCASLASLTIGNSVKSIGDSAFLSCTSLTSVNIPNSVIRIEESAFSDCSSLSSVTFEGKFSHYSSSRRDLFGIYISIFDGNLDVMYNRGGIGTYTTTAPVNDNSKWTKQK